jgi:predicted PurR-regulated permease PerM
MATTPTGGTSRPESTFDRAKPIALGLVLAILSVVALRLLAELRHVLILVFLAALFASAISRPAAVLERRRVPRGVAVALVHLTSLVVFVALAWVVVPPLVTQLAQFADQSPSYVTRFHRVRREYLAVRRHYPEVGAFDAQISSLAGQVTSGVGGQLVHLPLTAAELVVNLAIIDVLSTLLALRRERLQEAMLLMVSPSKRDRTRDVMEKIWVRLGGYLRAKLIVMACVGALTYVALRVLGVPFAVPLAVIVAFGELVPQVGVWIARIPLLTIAAFQGWTTLALTFLASFIIENLKAYVIGPRVEGHSLNMDPLLTILAVLSGSVLLGWEGALIAVPFAAMLQVLFEEVLIPMRLEQFGERPRPSGEQAQRVADARPDLLWAYTGRRPPSATARRDV